jgi:hypothetical protein
MAESKAKAAADAGQAEAQSKYDEAASQGFYGSVPLGPPNSAFSMESGPESPSPLEQHIAIHEGRGEAMRGAGGKS